MIIPKFSTLERWAASLIVDFPSDNIPLLRNGSDWRRWGNLVVREKSFSTQEAPVTNGFEDWKPWATEVYRVMINT